MDLLSWNSLLWLIWVAYWYVVAWFVKATRSSESMLGRMQHMLPLGIGFYLAFRQPPQFFGPLYASRPIQWLGMALTAAGLGFALWARRHLGRNWSGKITVKEGHELVRSGPYRLVRHPIYTGFASAFLGSALVARTGDAFIGFVIVLAALVIKLRREEALMSREFGERYQAFKEETAALVPFVF